MDFSEIFLSVGKV